MITDFTLKNLAFECTGYDTLLNALHYHFTHPTKGNFIAVMPDKDSIIEVDSVDYTINLVFTTLKDLTDWIQDVL